MLQALQRLAPGPQGFAEAKIWVPAINNIPLVREGLLAEGPEQPAGYSSCHYLGANSPDRLALVHVLARLMQAYAQEYLRMRGAPIARLEVRRLQLRRALFICLEAESRLSLVELEAEVEQVAGRFDDLLRALPQDVFDLAVAQAREELFPQFASTAEEAYARFKKSLQGQTLEQEALVKAQLQALTPGHVYGAYFSLFVQAARRVVAEAVSPSRLHDRPLSDNLVYNRLATLNLLIVDAASPNI